MPEVKTSGIFFVKFKAKE